MASPTTRGNTRLAPVENDVRPVLDLDPRRADAMFEERILRAQFKRERSSAYWFAASTWGIGGLVIGACLGAYMMHVAQVSLLPTAVNAVAQGMAVGDLRRDDGQQPNLLTEPAETPAANPTR
jgi:hypothetical protein